MARPPGAKDKTGKSYERLTQRVFESIQLADGVQTMQVLRDIKLVGKTATHQIDVFWEFVHGGFKYANVVQAKDEKRRISQGKMLQFVKVLEDLTIAAKGFFVTTTGFQKGALEVAAKHGIEPIVLREPGARDFIVKEIEFSIYLTSKDIRHLKFDADEIWVKQQAAARGIDFSEVATRKPTTNPNEAVLLDDMGNESIRLAEILDSKFEEIGEDDPPRPFTHRLDPPLYLATEWPDFPLLRVHQIEMTLAFKKSEPQVIHLKSSRVVRHIMQHAISGDSRTFDADGNQLHPRVGNEPELGPSL